MHNLKYTIILFILVFCLASCSATANSHAGNNKTSSNFLEINSKNTVSKVANIRHGLIKIKDKNDYQVWSKDVQNWMSVQAFWLAYAEQRGGLTWGQDTVYPPYNQVKELDTMIIQLDSGHCLMEFWHTRWRRANDVRRWDDKFNDYGGCPGVFK